MTALCVLPGGQLVLERRPLMAPSPQRCRDSKGSGGARGSWRLGVGRQQHPSMACFEGSCTAARHVGGAGRLGLGGAAHHACRWSIPVDMTWQCWSFRGVVSQEPSPV